MDGRSELMSLLPDWTIIWFHSIAHVRSNNFGDPQTLHLVPSGQKKISSTTLVYEHANTLNWDNKDW